MRRQYADAPHNSETLWDTKELEKGNKKDSKDGTTSVRKVMRLEPFSERCLGKKEKWWGLRMWTGSKFSPKQEPQYQMIVAQDRLEASRKTLAPSGLHSHRSPEHTLVGMLNFVYVWGKKKKKRKKNPWKAVDHQSLGLSETLAAGSSKALARKPCCTFVLSLFSL